MTLGELIARLEAAGPRQVVPHGFTRPHSYRGYYHELAFEPAENITVAEMLTAAKAALGATFTGYKGGEYRMSEYTDVWLARYGECGEGIGPMLLDYMLATPPHPTAPARGERADHLIWSVEHNLWWAPNECGYRANILQAGLYTKTRAEEIARAATYKGKEYERAVPLASKADELRALTDAALRMLAALGEPTPTGAGVAVDGERLDTAECSTYPNAGRCTHIVCLLRERNAANARLSTVTTALLAAREDRDTAREEAARLRREREAEGESLRGELRLAREAEARLSLRWIEDSDTIRDLRDALAARDAELAGVREDAERLDAIERHGLRIQPDGMDGWLVRGPMTQFGMRQGHPRYGAHRLREAIDAAALDVGDESVLDRAIDAARSGAGKEG